MAKRILSVAFKAYHQHQVMLLSPSLDELISPGHPVRVVNEVLDKIDIDPLLKNTRVEAPAVFIRACCSKF